MSDEKTELWIDIALLEAHREVRRQELARLQMARKEAHERAIRAAAKLEQERQDNE
jgi:hypothetical protein